MELFSRLGLFCTMIHHRFHCNNPMIHLIICFVDLVNYLIIFNNIWCYLKDHYFLHLFSAHWIYYDSLFDLVFVTSFEFALCNKRLKVIIEIGSIGILLTIAHYSIFKDLIIWRICMTDSMSNITVCCYQSNHFNFWLPYC